MQRELCSRSRFGARGSHHGVVKQQFELVAQAHSSRDALALLRCIVAGQHNRIDGRNLLPDLLVYRKEGDLLGTHGVVAHEGRPDTGAYLDEDVLAGTHRGDFLRHRAVGEHPVEEIRERHAARKWLHRVKIGS